MSATKCERCPGCGVELAAVEGPVHRYLESSPSCWATFGEVLAREYSDRAFMAVHRLTVDAYAVQHPGQSSPQAIQSVAVHLISLFAMLEQGYSNSAATRLIKQCVESMRFEWLQPPSEFGPVTVASVIEANSPEEHTRTVRSWAEAAWQAWTPHHPRVRAWVMQVQAHGG